MNSSRRSNLTIAYKTISLGRAHLVPPMKLHLVPPHAGNDFSASLGSLRFESRD